jgi:hypothetical protein
MHRSYTALAIVFVLLWASPLLLAQTTGNIDGTVMDDTGAVLPGATVTISSEALLGGSRTSVTGNTGSFRFPSLPVGTYSVQAELSGFETVRVDIVEVALGRTATVPITMKVASVAETVTVVGESPVVDVRNAGTGTNFRKEILEEVPTRRNMYDLMQVSAGMTADYGDGQSDRVVAFGSNRQSNSWNIDGINVSAPETGSAWWSVNVDDLEEVQVYGVGAPAEFGNYTGAVLNVVTKKGGNEFSGGANYFFQTNGLLSSSILVDPNSGEQCSGSTEGCLGFHRDQYRDITGRLGGPISRDNIWFYGSFQSFRDGITRPGNEPGLPGVRPIKTDKGDIKLTAKLGENHEIGGLFHMDEWASEIVASPFIDPSANGAETGSNPAWGVNTTSVLSDNTIMELKYAGWWSDDIYKSATDSLEEPFIDYTPPDGGPARYSGGLWYPWNYVTWKQQFNAKVTNYAEDFLGAEHDFRFGVQFSRGSAKTTLGIGATGSYAYNYYGYLYRATQDPYNYGGESRDLGVFLDDTVKAGDRVTLNLGVRADFNKGWIPDYAQLTIGEPSVSPSGLYKETGQSIPGVNNVIDWKIVSPRLGITLQPTEGGRSVIRASFGVYYDQNVIGNWDAPAPGRPTYTLFYVDPNTGAQDPLVEIPAEKVSISPDLRPPRTLQYAAGFQQQFGRDSSIEVQYVYKDTKDLVGWEILNGVYETVPFTDPFTGNQYSLLSQMEQPVLRKGNDPGNFPGSEDLDYVQKYHGVAVTFNKRFANRWGLVASYTWSKSEGLIPRMFNQVQFNPFYGSKEGSDPNNFINAYGRLQGDRPHMFRTQGTFLLPGEINVAANLNLETGKATKRLIRVGGLGQGTSTVIMAPGGSFDEGLGRDMRFPNVYLLDITVGKIFEIGDTGRFRVDGIIYNLFNEAPPIFYGSGTRESGIILQEPGEDFIAGDWYQPRRLMIRVGFDF